MAAALPERAEVRRCSEKVRGSSDLRAAGCGLRPGLLYDVISPPFWCMLIVLVEGYEKIEDSWKMGEDRKHKDVDLYCFIFGWVWNVMNLLE